MVAMPNMNWMGADPSGSAFDVYQYYLGGGNPNATPGGGGGTTGIMQAYQPTGGTGGGALQVGDPMMNASNFYKRGWDAWQNKNNPTLKDSFLVFQLKDRMLILRTLVFMLAIICRFPKL